MFGQLGAHDESVAAGPHTHLGGQGNPHHAGARHGDAIRVQIHVVDAIQIILDRVTQLGAAAGMRVEGVACVDGALGRFANEFRGDAIAFADPERCDAGIGKAGQRDPGNAARLQVFDLGTQQGHRYHLWISCDLCEEGMSREYKDLRGGRQSEIRLRAPRTYRPFT